MKIQKTLFLFVTFLTLSFYCMAQLNEKKYDSIWKNVAALTDKQGLTKSALSEVNKIYQLAKKEKKDGQLLKALIYQLNLNANFEDDDKFTGIKKLENETTNSSPIVSAILNNLLAEKYFNYFQQNRFKLYGRTETVNFRKDDIATWTIADFHKKISDLYVTSLKNKKLLQQTKLEPFEPIIIKGNARHLRPTMYDLLAHRALNYFRSDERDIDKPYYAFELRDEKLFLPASAFAKLNIRSDDSLSLHHKALLICQQLISFHANDKNPDALIDADIIRLQIVYQYATMNNKDLLYTKALEGLAEKYPVEPVAAKAAWLLAQWHVEKGQSYDPLKDTTNRYEYVQALKICERIVSQKPESEGKSNCISLVRQIKQRELTLQTEKVNIPGQPFRTLVSFKNFTKIYLRVIPISPDLQKQLSNRYEESYWKELTALASSRKWNQSLPATNDYQKHNAEIKIDALPVGAYILLASINENFSLANNPLAVQYFHVSNISYINNGNNYFVLDRDNGMPLAKASVQVWINKYSATLRRDTLSRGAELVTDIHGSFRMPEDKKRNENFQLEIKYKNDLLFLNDYQYQVYFERNEDKIAKTADFFEIEHSRLFFFTDRSIYRPGQTVFFKGIAITKDFKTGNSKVYANRSSWVKLLNANGELADSVKITTNEFGSYTGNFNLPEHLLNGQFRLSDESLNGEVTFSVEEYKRPKFYVEYEKQQGNYKLNDSIQVTGYAKAYAGNKIGGATVKYRVVRNTRFIYPWLYRKLGIPRTSNTVIANGIVTTTVDGKFIVRFKAAPDMLTDKKLEPVFDYKVIADITDINGETRSGETLIPVSYKSIQLKINIPEGETLPVDSLKHLSISTKNLNGEFVSVMAHVVIHRLMAPERLIRQRYWSQPDEFVMSEDAYLKLFPYDEYRDEKNPNSWPRSEKVYDQTGLTKVNNDFGIQQAKLTTGWYSIEVSAQDSSGGEVKDIQFIQLFDDKSNKLPFTNYSWSMQKNPTVEPGEKSTISIGSSANDVYIIQQIDKQLHPQGSSVVEQDKEVPGYNIIRLSNERKSFYFPVTENDRGGFSVHHFFVKNNRFYSVTDQVNVPWTNKELFVSYESFRDKTLPGSEEKWKLKIKGSKSEKVAAEMLASMYDASLDQFLPHNWTVPYIWPLYSGKDNWNGQYNFSAVQSQGTYWESDNNIKYYADEYDQILSFPDRNRILIRGMSSVRAPIPGQTDRMPDGMAGDKRLKISNEIADVEADKSEEAIVTGYGNKRQTQNPAPIQMRKNFKETAFFFPDLKTDSEGNISFGFTIPEALTRWKFQALSHTKEAAFGYSTNDIITQKQLMVQPNAPRFLREGDLLELSTKIVNMTDKELTGTVQLELLNAADMKPVDGLFQNKNANQYFTAGAGRSVSASFSVQVPYQYHGAVVYRFVAKSSVADISDGEEAPLPVLTNSMLVTESLPLNLRGANSKNFRFEKLLQSGSGVTLQQHSVTVEFTSNPAWYAVQALPYLIEYPDECSEQTFNRFYANALASKIASGSPRIKAIFAQWKSAGEKEGGLVSNLNKNPELKAVLLEETPWVLEAKSELQQQKNIALLFDMVRMSGEIENSISKLQQMQLSNGGFSWFNGGPDDRFITQYIVTGIGHLKKLNVAMPAKLNDVIRLAISYLDKRLKEDYDNLLKSKSDLKNNNTGYQQVQYLYMRSFFSEYGIAGETVNAATYYRRQSQQFWMQQNRFMQGMIALSLDRTGDHKTAGDILKSLQQNAIVNEEMGMHWKENRGGYFWYQAPVETQSLLIEAFSEIIKDNQTVDDLKTWLLKQKQTQHWPSTKATADACYALLLQGTDWLNNEPAIEINIGNNIIKSSEQQQQAGTGYFKKVFDGPDVNPSMGIINITTSAAQKSQGASVWGAVYWQYFEQLDKITPSSTPLQLNKKLFVEKNSDRGTVLTPIAAGTAVKVGDKIKVRIELRVDRDMEYVHLKDMRASCLEPVNVVSSYKWQGGLGYYESTKDASTNFFFNWLPKGTYVFEYPLFVSQAGNFSNGVSSIQCMYAPEFTSHSEGVRLTVE